MVSSVASSVAVTMCVVVCVYLTIAPVSAAPATNFEDVELPKSASEVGLTEEQLQTVRDLIEKKKRGENVSDDSKLSDEQKAKMDSLIKDANKRIQALIDEDEKEKEELTKTAELVPTLTEKMFNRTIELSGKQNSILVIYFHASWCGERCRMMSQIMNIIAEGKAKEKEQEKIMFAAVDAGKYPNAGEMFEVSDVPVIKILRGAKVYTYAGDISLEALEMFVNSKLNPPSTLVNTMDEFNAFVTSNGKDTTFLSFVTNNNEMYDYLNVAFERMADVYSETGFRSVKILTNSASMFLSSPMYSPYVYDTPRSVQAYTMPYVFIHRNYGDEHTVIPVPLYEFMEKHSFFKIKKSSTPSSTDNDENENEILKGGPQSLSNAELSSSSVDFASIPSNERDIVTDMTTFIEDNRLPVVMPMDRANYMHIFNKKTKYHILFFRARNYKHIAQSNRVLKEFKGIVDGSNKSDKGLVNVIYVDEMMVDFIDFYGFGLNALPKLCILYTPNPENPVDGMLKYVSDFNKINNANKEFDINSEYIMTFYSLVVEGKYPKYVKSHGSYVYDKERNIHEINGAVYDDKITNNTKDILLFIYSYSCSDCRAIEKNVLNIYSRKVRDIETLQIMKINGDGNDIPFEFSGYPTILLMRGGTDASGAKRKVYTFPGKIELNINSLHSFIKKYANYPVGFDFLEELDMMSSKEL